MEDLLNKAVGNYIKQKERQKMKPITSDCETSLTFENNSLYIKVRDMRILPFGILLW